ncbi:mitochondrial intermediate peptidase [Periplaneta americana]|uniref:mitochondrial intermediate peptidase n=1 Tax=Periplaneta americana TaxID=6978 RepID=UPI0037E9314A
MIPILRIRNSNSFIKWNLQIAYVSTWSPLATAFNTRPGRKLNLSLTQEDAGLFGIPELKSHEGFYAMKESAAWKTDALVAESYSPNRTRKMVEIFDELSDTLCKVADLAEFIRIAHPQAAYSQAAEDACVSVSGIVEKLNTHRQLYSALRSVVDSEDIFPTTPVDQHVARLFLFDFEQCGIHLPQMDRRRVVELNDSILQLGQRFMAGAASPRALPKESLPQNLRHFFSVDGNQVLVTGLYADSPNAMAREAAYRIFLYPDKHQEYLLTEMLTARHELACLCGFPTFSHRALKASTAETPGMVNEFLEDLSEQLRERAAADYNTMKNVKNAENTGSVNEELAPWDTPYYTQKVKKEWLQIGGSEFSPYFSLGTCMEGLNNLMNSLYHINLVNDEVLPGEVWSPDVYKLAVIHETEGLLGHIYCDFYERPGKPNQDCHFTIRGGKEMADGSYQNPVVVLMLNLPPPRWSNPSLLTPGMVDNLFHEMGHAMHSMLARTRYQHVTGTRCTTDFAEVPSVLMEYFASDPRVVRTFAKHFQTSESMPEDMLVRLCASKHLFAASEMQVQVFYSALDQRYHGMHPLPGSTTDVLNEIQNKYYGIPCVPNTAWQLRFSHLVGYGAKYYSYLMSRAIAAWIWQTYFEADPFNSSSGEKYRQECLAHGGGKPARELVAHFLGREVTSSNLVNSLINEIDSKHEIIERLRH